MFLGSQRVGETLGGTAGPQRLLLRVIGRPAGQVKDLETRRDSPVGAAVEIGITRRRVEQLEEKLANKNEVIAELMEENVRAKKANGEL